VTNFKSGSGNLDFDGDDSSAESQPDSSPSTGSRADSEQQSSERAESQPVTTTDQPPTDTDLAASSDGPATKAHTGGRGSYPYFVRRSNVGDERDTRLEIHVRDKVAEGEAQFRHALADELDATEVSKTDAREFALLAAFRHPERVAELMREEGFDSLS